MSGNIHVNLFIDSDQPFAEGYKLGSMVVHDACLHFMADNPVPQLEQLRDECQRQIDALNRVLPSNASAEELAAPYLMPSAAPPLEGQPLYDPPPDAAACPRCGGLGGTHTTRGCGEPIVLGPSDIVRIAQEAGDDTPF